MKVLIAPDSFKESLPAAEVAQAMARGVVAACEDAQIDLCPMADGGEGTVEAMVAATGGRFLTADVFGPLGKKIRARFGMLGHAAGTALPGELGLVGAKIQSEGLGHGGIGYHCILNLSGANTMPGYLKHLIGPA